MKLTLIDKEHLIDNVWAFRFRPSEQIKWTPGQFMRVELPHNNPDGEGTKRYFTVSSAPYEGFLQITTRVTDSTFKQALAALSVGSEDLQLIEKPDGDFVWQDSDKPIVFVAGGIGVTPFHSILKQRAYDGKPLNVTLVYGSRGDNVPFKEELKQWQEQDPRLKVQYIVGEPLTAEKLAEVVPELNQSLAYVSGPEPMVEKLSDELTRQGLPQSQLRQDSFPHYDKSNY